MNIKINKTKRNLKAFSLAILSFGFSYNAVSQIQKGQWLIGGNGGFNYFKYYTTKTYSVSLSPSGAYFVRNRLALGLRLGYNQETYKYSPDRKSRESFISLTPFLRYYFLSYEHKVNLFVDGGFGYSWGKFKNSSNRVFKYKSKVVSLKAGPAIFLNERTALEFTLGYDHSIRGSLGDTLGVSSFQIGVGLQVHIGKSTN